MAQSPIGRIAAASAAIVVLVFVAAGVVVYRMLPRSGLTPAPHDWTAEWRSDPPVVETLPGGLLETATMRMGEDFYKSDARTWWGLYLGNTVSHIQVAAVYRYGVPLDDGAWRVATRGQTAVVVAPVLRPSLPVAVDTSTWREKTESGWARFDKQAQLDDLRRGLSADLATRAADERRVALAREASRRTIGEFVERWLLAQDAGWTPGVFSAVKVYFDDEIDEDLSLELRSLARPAAPATSP
ncbi:MAG: hypothetical protein AB7O93_19500 [Vicinamibacterales bacterium]